jgi:hypothetical protein
MQDGPFLGMRLYLLIHFNVINQMMIFFTIKNILVILLQLYRMSIVCWGDTGGNDVDAEADEMKVTDEPSEEDTTNHNDHKVIITEAS